jgi:hypothetical protein
MLIATVEDVLRVNETEVDWAAIARKLGCNVDETYDAVIRLYRHGFINHGLTNITPDGHEFIRRAEAGWPAEEVG